MKKLPIFLAHRKKWIQPEGIVETERKYQLFLTREEALSN